MAKAISSEELQMRKRARRRLVGAIALVAIVVLFLPMILDNEPKPVSQDIAISIAPPSPDQDEADASLAEPPPLRFRPAEEPSDHAESGKPVTPQTTEEPRRPLPATPEPVVQKQPVSSATPKPRTAAVADSFVVQLGAFSDAENASRLAAKVRDNRFSAYTEVVSTSGGKRTRVRVGPYPTRAAAEEARDRLQARRLTYGEPVIVRSSD